MKASASTSKKSLRPKGPAPATFAAKADSNHRLILFDIDGTLVLTGGAGGRAMSRAFEDLFGIADAFRGIPMAGRTDTAILSDALNAHRIALTDSRITSYRDRYFHVLPGEIQNRPPNARHGVMPGVRELLDALTRRDDVYLALLTGNYEISARMKLEYFDLWRYFACGAFGDEAPERNALFGVARERLAAHGGPMVRAERAVVVGDTPHDIAVAIAAGARSMGVATGSHSVAALRAAGADHVFEDLSDTDAVLQALE
jgi:phosphoglycolate phosphatase